MNSYHQSFCPCISWGYLGDFNHPIWPKCGAFEDQFWPGGWKFEQPRPQKLERVEWTESWKNFGVSNWSVHNMPDLKTSLGATRVLFEIEPRLPTFGPWSHGNIDALGHFAEVSLGLVTYNTNSIQCGVQWVRRFTSEQKFTMEQKNPRIRTLRRNWNKCINVHWGVCILLNLTIWNSFSLG